MVAQDVEVVVVEGNYLLVGDAPWSDLADVFDLTVMLEVSQADLLRRLTQRWRDAGLDEAEVTAKVEENDMPNGRFVAERSRPADFAVTNEG